MVQIVGVLALALCSLAATPDGTNCDGCYAKKPPPKADSGNVTVPFTWVGSGPSGVRFLSGKCTEKAKVVEQDPGSTSTAATNATSATDELECVEERGCRILGTLQVKNTSSAALGRRLVLTVTVGNGSPSKHSVDPGTKSDPIVFGDPGTGTFQKLPCGAKITIEIACAVQNQRGEEQVETRTYTFECTDCD